MHGSVFCSAGGYTGGGGGGGGVAPGEHWCLLVLVVHAVLCHSVSLKVWVYIHACGWVGVHVHMWVCTCVHVLM